MASRDPDQVIDDWFSWHTFLLKVEEYIFSHPASVLKRVVSVPAVPISLARSTSERGVILAPVFDTSGSVRNGREIMGWRTIVSGNSTLHAS